MLQLFYKLVYPLIPLLLIALGSAVAVTAFRRKISGIMILGGIFAALAGTTVLAWYVFFLR